MYTVDVNFAVFDFFFSDLKKFCRHVKKHQHIEYRFGKEQCHAFYQTFSAFRSHMHRNHRHRRPQTKHTDFEGNYTCGFEACYYVAEKFSSLCAHLRFPIKDGKKVVCPLMAATNISGCDHPLPPYPGNTEK